MALQKAQFRDCLKQFSREAYSCEISALTDIARSDALTLAYILKVFNPKSPGLYPDDIEDLRFHIVDGSGDRGADFIYRSDSQVYVIQSKYRNPDALEKEPEFDHFRSVLKRLCPDTGPKQKRSQKVLDIISEIDWETDQFTLIYLSLAKPNPQLHLAAEGGVDNVPNSPLRDINDRCTLEYYSEVELNEQYRDVLKSSSGQIPTVDILLAQINESDEQRFLELDQGSGRRCFIGALSAGQIHQLYQRNKGNLFNLNIRNYIGDTRTNKDIIKTSIEEPQHFFFYNNGISAVARKVHVEKVGENTVLKCTDFSVINGAQTFRSIAKAHSKDRVATEPLLVPIRITEFDFNRNWGDAFLDSVTKYNNTQNAIKISDFRSNDPVQMSISTYMSKVIPSDGRKFVYRNKRSQVVDRSKTFIGLDEFCRSVHAFLFGPADLFGGLSYLYDTSTKGGYSKLFNDPSEPLAEKTFDEYFGAWLMCSHGRDRLKSLAAQRDAQMETADDDEKAILTLEKNALERRYHVFYAMSEILREICKINQKDFESQLSSFARPKWREDSKKRELVDKIIDIACGVMAQTYQVYIKTSGNLHRNFFRDEKFAQLVRESLSTRRSELRGVSI